MISYDNVVSEMDVSIYIAFSERKPQTSLLPRKRMLPDLTLVAMTKEIFPIGVGVSSTDPSFFKLRLLTV